MREVTAVSMLSLAVLLCYAASVSNAGTGVSHKEVEIKNGLTLVIGNDNKVQCHE